MILNTEDLSTLKIHKLTQAQYDRELEAGNIDPNALYLTPDEEIDLSQYATIEQVNSKADINHTHTFNEVDARPSTWMPTAGDVGAYSKAEVINNATKALFGLDENAVPDDVLAFLGKYNQHWWERTVAGEREFVRSSDRNAYPDSGESDGYEWKYLGVPFENMIQPSKMETGSYVGTGSSSTMVLTTTFNIKLAVIGTWKYGIALILPGVGGLWFGKGNPGWKDTTGESYNTFSASNIKTDDNTLTLSESYLNMASCEYSYILFGQ